MAGAARSAGGGAAARAVSMLDSIPGKGPRQAALGAVRAALARNGGAPPSLVSMRADSPVESWDRLFVELEEMGEGSLAERVAVICRGMRQDMWQAIDGDPAMLAQVYPMCDQFYSARDDAVAGLRYGLAAVSDAASASFRPGREMRDAIVNMARFGSMADDRAIRVIVEELYVRRGHHGPALDICSDIMSFRGHDRGRMLSSTLVEGIVGDVLSAVRDSQDEAPEPGAFAPPRPSPRESAQALERCMRILRRRARSLGISVPPGAGGGALLEASALALRISGRRQARLPGEIARHAGLHHPRSHRFLRLDLQSSLSRLARPGSPLARNASAEMASRGGARRGHGALGLLEALLERMELGGISAGATKKWQDGIRGTRLWGTLLEMEMYLRLRLVGARVSVACGGGGAPLELGGCRLGVHSPLDAAWPGRAGARTLDGLLGAGGRRTVVVADCPQGVLPGRGALRDRLAPCLAAGRGPGALFLVRRSGGRYTHEILESPSPERRVPNTVKGAIRRALGENISGLSEPGGAA